MENFNSFIIVEQMRQIFEYLKFNEKSNVRLSAKNFTFFQTRIYCQL